MTATLPQLLDRFRALTATDPGFTLHDQIDYTYQSMVLEGVALPLPDVQALLQTNTRLPDQPSPDLLRVIDHHQALVEVLSRANQHEPLNRAVLQDWASTLSRQTGDTIHTLLGSYDTRRGELRADSGQVSGRKLIDAQKLPAALDALVKGLNSTLPRLKTPRQVYDFSFAAHFQLLTLHPFGSGNGPIARLLMSYVQEFHQLPLSRVYADSRTGYRAALAQSWQDRSEGALGRFMHEQLVRYLRKTIDEFADNHP